MRRTKAERGGAGGTAALLPELERGLGERRMAAKLRGRGGPGRSVDLSQNGYGNVFYGFNPKFINIIFYDT